jgi:hypothetical protein
LYALAHIFHRAAKPSELGAYQKKHESACDGGYGGIRFRGWRGAAAAKSRADGEAMQNFVTQLANDWR